MSARDLPVEAVEHALAAGDPALLATLLDEHHLSLIRGGSFSTLLHGVRELPDDELVDRPELGVAAALTALLAGGGLIEHRRYLRLVECSRSRAPEGLSAYVEAAALVSRAMVLEDGVERAVDDSRRAIQLATDGADEVVTGTLAVHARALYFAGDLDGAWAAALEALEHPRAERRVPSVVSARSTLALVAAERGWHGSARRHAAAAKEVTGRIGTSRSWIGANAACAIGVVLEGEGRLAEAERELSQAEHNFRDEVATVHHAWVLLLLARVRTRRGRLEEAEATLGAANESLAELGEAGRRLLALAGDVARELDEFRARAGSGELLEAPTEAELAVLHLLATDLSARQIGERLFLSVNTVRSHTRAVYRKLGVRSRPEAVARANALGLLDHLAEPGSSG